MGRGMQLLQFKNLIGLLSLVFAVQAHAVVDYSTETVKAGSVYIGSTLNVGIGSTANMLGAVRIGTSTSPGLVGSLLVKATAANDWHSAFQLQSANGTYVWQFHPDNDGNLYYRSATGSKVFARTSSAGLWAVGAGSPVSGSQMTVWSDTSNIGLTVRASDTASASSQEWQDTNGQTNAKISKTGALGIGGSTLPSVSDLSMYFVNDTDTGIYRSAANTMNLAVGGSSAVQIGTTYTDLAGRVRIGTTTSALSPLRVRQTDNTNWDAAFTLESNNQTKSAHLFLDNNGYVYWYPSYLTNFPWMHDNAGKMGFGTGSPEAQVTVGGVNDYVQLSVRAHSVQTDNLAQFKNSAGIITSIIGKTGAVGIGGTATSSTVPALYFIGDTNTGVGTSAADTLNLIAGGTSRLSIGTSGVGIGTTLGPVMSSAGGILSSVAVLSPIHGGTGIDALATLATGVMKFSLGTPSVGQIDNNHISASAGIGTTKLAALSASQVVVTNSSGFLSTIGIGTTGYVLTSNGGSAPSWAANVATVVTYPQSTETLTSGTTANRHYTFVISSGSATVGATYTHNSVTYTVIATVASATQVVLSGSAAPLSSGTLTKSGGTGDGTLTFTSAVTPVLLEVMCTGGGGSGGGGGSSSTPGGGSAGNTTTFGSTLLSCTGGGGGTSGTAGGGACTITAPAYGIAFSGNYGVGFGAANSNTYTSTSEGGGSVCYGGGGTANANSAGTAAIANTGGGGGGGSASISPTVERWGMSGGGSGGCARIWVKNPAASYSYSLAATQSTVGTAGTGGYAGGTGASGRCDLIYYYQ